MVYFKQQVLQLLKEKSAKNKKAKEIAEYSIFCKLISRTKQVQKVKELQEEISKTEEMEVEAPSLPKGVLPEDFFDDRVEGALAKGLKKKQAEKLARE